MIEAAIALEKMVEFSRFYSDWEERTHTDNRFLSRYISKTAINVGKHATPTYYTSEMAQIAMGAVPHLTGEEKIYPADLPDPEVGFIYCPEPIAIVPSVPGSPYTHEVHGYCWYTAQFQEKDGSYHMGWFILEIGIAVPNDDGPIFPGLEVVWATIWDEATVLARANAPSEDRLFGYVDAHGNTQYVPTDNEVYISRDIDVRKRFFSLVTFMNQKLVVMASARPPRAVRRRLPDWQDTTISVVTLRAKHYQNHDPGRGDEPSRQLSNRHVRRAHWHRHWCKTEDGEELRPIWHAPTVVGPAGTPIKDVFKLYDVRR